MGVPADGPDGAACAWTARTALVRTAIRACLPDVIPVAKRSAPASNADPVMAQEGAAAVERPPDDLAGRALEGGGARVRLLGCPAIFDRAGERVGGLRETALELLVFLVVHRGGVSAAAIRRDVYAGAAEHRAGERLSTDLANLRERLRYAAGADRRVNPVARERDGYRLVPELLEVDWWGVLDDCRRLATRPDGDEPVPDREAVLRRLVAAFEGGVLADGAGYEWLVGLQERSRRTGIAVYRKLAAVLSRSDRREAASVLDRACDLDPFDEDLARQAISAFRACGEEAAASARWEVLRAALAELGETPTAATAAAAHGAASG